LDKYRLAGKILSSVARDAAKMVKKGEKLLSVAEFAEEEIKRRGVEATCENVPFSRHLKISDFQGDESKIRLHEIKDFVAFPCNISLDDEAAHRTPFKGEETRFNDEIVKLDIGSQIDGYIADMAVTIDLSGEREELKRASEAALNNAIDLVHAGVNTKDLSETIEKTITDFGYRPIADLSGHGLLQYDAHAPPTISNRCIKKGVDLKEGQVIAIEPFATDGIGRTKRGNILEIYRLLKRKPVRPMNMRRFLDEVEEYKTLPFAKRWLRSPSDIMLNQLVDKGILYSFPVLKEESGGFVAQKEHTMIVLEDGCEVTTK